MHPQVQNLVNTIWAWATLGHPPTRATLDELEAALERLVGQMNEQDVRLPASAPLLCVCRACFVCRRA